ncbi:MAG: 23S rRNA (guanosine(2251)-2'-O)-methyltransferase RlmB [Candidatus Polarisedimenticolia bacterium]
MSGAIHGIHPVLEALAAGSGRVTRVVVAEGRRDGRLIRVLEAARAARVPVQRQPEKALDRLAGGEPHQGVVALIAAAPYADPEEALRQAARPELLVVLDGVEDPRNLGAVIRAAAGAGADALFLPERRAAGLTAVAEKAAAGAAERLPVARVGNVVAFLNRLKEQGIWVAGLDPAGTTAWTDYDLTGPVALVLGGEGKGLRRLCRETCDLILRIPLMRGVESLNLSVAAAVVLFEARRQRLQKAAGRPPEGPPAAPRGGPAGNF